MIVKRRGGMTEFIPSPQEKREGLVRDHSFNLIENLHHRLSRLEEELGGYRSMRPKLVPPFWIK